MCSELRPDLLQSELLVFSMKNMSGFQLTFSSNDFSLLSDVCFTERGEVAVGGKLQPAHSSPILCFLPSLIFYMQQFNLLEHGGAFSQLCLVTLVTLLCRDPLTGPCSSPNTCVHLYPFSFMHPVCFTERIRVAIWEPPLVASTFFSFLHAFSSMSVGLTIHSFFAVVTDFFDVTLNYVFRSASCAGSWTPPKKRFPP